MGGRAAKDSLGNQRSAPTLIDIETIRVYEKVAYCEASTPLFAESVNMSTVTIPSFRCYLPTSLASCQWTQVLKIAQVRKAIHYMKGAVVVFQTEAVSESDFSRSEYVSLVREKYFGQLEHEQKNGLGLKLWENGSTFYGVWVNGEISGIGILTHPNGDSYHGHWRKNRANGFGVYLRSGGKRYSGQWHNDRMHGQGQIDWPEKMKYEGELADGKKSGRGELETAAGDKYVGGFAEDKFEGEGEMKWRDGRTYTGTWHCGQPHGHGTYTWPASSFKGARSYCGEYKHGKKHGLGTFTWSDGSRYTGEWRSGRQHGTGKLQSVDGTIHLESWCNGLANTTDLEDIGDRVAVLEGVVEELAMPMKPRAEVLILMRQYAHLEDAILTGIQDHMRAARRDVQQQRLLAFIEQFNKVGFEFQETWSEDYWNMYEEVRGVKKKEKGDKSAKQLEKEISEVQDLALGLSRLDRFSAVRQGSSRPILPKPQTLFVVDQESRKFREEAATAIAPPRKRLCYNCCIA